MANPGRNDPCPCGSGKRYKHCCGQSSQLQVASQYAAQAAPDIPKIIQLALEHHRAGRLEQAKFLYQQVLQVEPEHHQALHFLGLVANQEGENDKAVQLINRAIQASPSNPGYCYNLGCVYNALNRPDDAIACYRRALAIKPDYIEAFRNLGNTLKDLGKLDEAITCYQKALVVMPTDVTALVNLGVAFEAQGRLDAAMVCYQKAIAIKPDFVEAHNNLGIAFKEQGNLDAALACYQKALSIRPDYAEVHNNLGNVRNDQGQLDEAVACFQRAITIQPDYAEAHYNLGNAHKELGKIDRAIACYQQALSVRPDHAKAHNNKLLVAHHAMNFSPEELFNEHLKFAEQFEAPLKSSWRIHSNPRDPEKRLRVGYVSPDFRNHAVAYFIEPVLANHDKSMVEVFCYYNHNQHDDFTDRIIAVSDLWVPCQKMSDDQLAERIRSDGIDVLVDLAGHTGLNRLSVFARKPAPVQVNYLGYIDTTGLSSMDYRLTHIDADPLANDTCYSETLYRLPGKFWWCYRPRTDMPEVAPSPAVANGFVTFGSTNTFSKISPETIEVWAEILRALPDSRLMILGVPQGSARDSITDRFVTAGIAIHRLIVHGRVTVAQFCELHHQIDIVLDPFPYNGGTTTCDALWLGVPVVALTGQAFVSRMGYALLKNIGLPELAAQSKLEYVNIAVGLASNLERLNALRAGMRPRLLASSLMDEAGFARKLETAYRDMWRKHCAS